MRFYVGEKTGFIQSPDQAEAGMRFRKLPGDHEMPEIFLIGISHFFLNKLSGLK